MLKRKGKELLSKTESKKEFSIWTKVDYAKCMNPLLEGDKLRPGEVNELCCQDKHLYSLFGRIEGYKSDEYMRKWLSFYMLVHRQAILAKAGQYLKLKKLKLDTWAEGVKTWRRGDILSVFTLSVLIGKHTMVHL